MTLRDALAIEVRPTELRALYVRGTRRTTDRQPTSAATRPRDLGALLDRLVGTHAGLPVALVVAAGSVRFRTLSLELTRAADFGRVCRYEIEQHLALDSIDDYAVDHLPVDDTGAQVSSLVAVLPKTMLADLLPVLRKRGMEPWLADVDMIAASALMEGEGVLARIESDGCALAVRDGRLRVVRAFGGPDRLDAEVRRSCLAARVPASRVFRFGEAVEDGELPATAALDGALLRLTGSADGLNFLQDELRVPVGGYFATAVAGALCLAFAAVALLGVHVTRTIGAEQARTRAAITDCVAAYAEACGEAPALAGDELQQARHLAGEVDARLAVSAGNRAGSRRSNAVVWSLVAGGLRNWQASPRPWRLTELSIDDQEVRIRGVLMQMEDEQALWRALLDLVERHPHMLAQAIHDVSRAEAGKGWQFDYRLIRVRETGE